MTETTNGNDDETPLATSEDIAARGEEIYARDYKKKYEAEHPGQFVAIDVTTGKAYVHERSGGALETANEAAPSGVFYLIKVGARSAFRMTQRVASDEISGQLV